MKKIICLFLALITAVLTAGCKEKEEERYVVGAWISYVEMDRFVQTDFKKQYISAVKTCKSAGVTDLFVHVRPFCDSVYPSKLFPMRKGYENLGFDALEFMVETAHGEGLKFHAWINPYRVKAKSEDISLLDGKSPAKKWFLDSNAESARNVCFSNGIYLNPAESLAQKLVVDGIHEILSAYSVDGIHFDDYFYPTKDYGFDSDSYNEYLKDCENPIPVGEWRRTNVNKLISEVYRTVKKSGKDKIFSISPAAGISKNYYDYYADTALWMKNGTVDWMIPQLYFGFDYPDSHFRFDNLLNEWNSLKRKENVKLIIGLPLYRMYGTDFTGWEEFFEPDLIARMINMCRNTEGISGHVYYSCTSFYKPQNVTVLQEILDEESKYKEKKAE